MTFYTVIGTEIDGRNVAVAVLWGEPTVWLSDTLTHKAAIDGDWIMRIRAANAQTAMTEAVAHMNR